MSHLELDVSQPFTLDEDGYLADRAIWSKEVAEQLASEEHITLSPIHWAHIELVQRYFAEFDHAPAMRPLVNWIKVHRGADEGNSRFLHHLFPVSPAKQLARIAGLPKPTKCL